MGTANREITVTVAVAGVPEHVTDQQVIDKLASYVPFDLTWPAPRASVLSARVVTPATAPAEATPAE